MVGFEEFQRLAVAALEEGETPDQTLSYIILSATEEMGELNGRIRPHFRGQPVDKVGLIDDLADLQWYLAVIAHLFGIDCEQVAAHSIRKVALVERIGG